MLRTHLSSLLKISSFTLLLLYSSSHVNAQTVPMESGTIKVAGGTAHIAFMQEIATKLSQENPEFKVLISGGGSGVGVQKLGAGLVDLANTGRPLSPEEKTRYDLRSYPLAYDAIAFVVHPENPLANLKDSELQKIFSGEVQTWEHWSKFSKQPIHLYVRDEASGTQDIFVEKIMKGKAMARGANVTNSNGAMKLAVANDRFGIGFLSFGYLDESVKALRLDGHRATVETVRFQRYPLTRVLYVNSHRKTSEFLNRFLNYLRGPESAEIIEKWGLLPVYVAKKQKDKRKK